MRIIIVVTVFVFFGSIRLGAQQVETRSSLSWQKYSTQTKIKVGALNLTYVGFMVSKQHFMPVKTQKWVVPAVSGLVIGFTLYKGFEYNKRKPVTKRFNYRG